MNEIQKYREAWENFSKEKNHYWNEATQTGYGCSSGTCRCLRDATIIKEGEYFHALGNYEGVLGDSSRFKKIKFNPTILQPMDILVKWGAHVATYVGDIAESLYECAPERTHSLATNGTGCGLHYGHSIYNCATGTRNWDYIYRIIEKSPSPSEKFTQETIEKSIARAEEIANNDYYGYDNNVGNNLGADFGQRGYDCGGFVSDSYRHAGVIPAGVVFEPNQPDGPWGYDSILSAAGFVRYPFNYNLVKRGDVLIRKGEHTEMVYTASPAKTIGAHSDKDGLPGDGYKNEISIVNMSANWDYMYRLPVGNDPDPEPQKPVLTYGSTGTAVKELQKILNDFGASLSVDGSFGPATLAAVKSFQASHGLDVDGSVGPLTWAVLLDTEKKEEKDYIRMWQTAAKADGLYRGEVDGSFGPLSRSASSFAIISGSRYTNLVIFWQTFLKDKGFYKDKIDASFGPATKQAVIDAQKAYRIDADGYIGPITSRTWLGVI